MQIFIVTLLLLPLISGSQKKSVELSKMEEKKPKQFPTLQSLHNLPKMSKTGEKEQFPSLHNLLRSMAKDVSAKQVIRKLFRSKLRRKAVLMKNKQAKLSFDKQDVQKLFNTEAEKSKSVQKKHSSQSHTYLLFRCAFGRGVLPSQAHLLSWFAFGRGVLPSHASSAV